MNVEWAILADYVELSGNKLYMMGGGWDSLTINNPLFQHSFGIAASFRAQLDEIDRPHEVAIQVLHVDSGDTVVDIRGNIEFAGASENSRLKSQLAHFGLNLTLHFQTEGLFHLVVRIEDQVLKEFPFYVAFAPYVRDLVQSRTTA